MVVKRYQIWRWSVWLMKETSFWASAYPVRLLFVNLLINVEKSLCDFQSISYPKSEYFETCDNRLISDELCYDREALGREHLDFVSKFTNEQLHVHDTIMSSVCSNAGWMFFVYDYGCTGKTFVWRSLSAGIRSRVILF